MSTDPLEHIADALLRSYDLDQVERPRLPDRKTVVDTLDHIRRILFPGYYAEERLPQASRRHHVCTWLCRLEDQLIVLIERCFAHGRDRTPQECNQQASEITSRFLGKLPGLREQLRLDAEAALVGDPAAQSAEEVILTYPGFQAITIHRVSHWLYREGVPFLPRIMSEYAHSQTGIDIHPGARIGESFFIDHGTGVVIGETTDIGNWVKIYQGVTLGALSVERKLAGAKRHPTIQDHVVLYAGATVLGGSTVIGKGAIVGGNVWLTESVKEQTTVLETAPQLDYRTKANSKVKQGDAS